MTRRLMAFMFAVAVVVVGHAPHNATAATAPTTINRVTAVTTYRVTMTGDSIAALSFGIPHGPGGVIDVGDGIYRNLNFGRGAYKWGQTMTAGNGSTWSIASLNISRTQAGGWVVIQDNSLDAASDWEWTKLMTDIEALTPDNVCLLGVLPGYLASGNPTTSATVARRATIMGQVFQRHSCRAFVFLNQYMAAHPAQFADGQHPDATAQAWIRNSITAWTR